MASCWQCQKVLQGEWNVTKCGETYNRTGRYLGIPDGYFLYSDQPNWVYCYCKACWQNQVIALPFVQAAIQKAAIDHLQTIIQAASVQGWNQVCQNISQYINTAINNGQNQTIQLISSLTSTIASSQQITNTKISELLTQQNQKILQTNTTITNGQNQTTQLITSLTSTIASSQQITNTKISELLNQQNQKIQQINTSITNGQNESTQLLSSLASSIASSQQNTKTKISELLTQQNQEIQLILQNRIQQQFTNQQTNSQLSDFIEKTITKIYQADQDIVQKEIEKQLNSINKIQCEKIVEFLAQAEKQNSQFMMSQTVRNQLNCANPLQSQTIDEINQEQNITEKQTLKYQYETRICPLIQTLSKTIMDSQTICQIYQSDNGKSTSIIQGIWQELEIILLEKISSSLIKVVDQLQQNYNTAVNQVESITKARDQFLGYLKSSGVQNYIDYEGHIKIFEQDIQKYYKEDLFNLLNTLKELQQSVKN